MPNPFLTLPRLHQPVWLSVSGLEVHLWLLPYTPVPRGGSPLLTSRRQELGACPAIYTDLWSHLETLALAGFGFCRSETKGTDTDRLGWKYKEVI